MVEAENAIVVYEETELPPVASLSIPAKKNSTDADMGLNRPVLLGMISGVAITLCIANLVAFILNLILVSLIIITLVHPNGLKPITIQAVNKLRSMLNQDIPRDNWLGDSSQSLLQAVNPKLSVDYRPFEAEVAMIMDIAEDFSRDDLQLRSELANIDVMEMAQEIRVEEIHLVRSGAQQFVRHYQEIRIEKTIPWEELDEMKVEDESIWEQDNRHLLDNDLGQYSAEDYTEEIDDLYRQAFLGAPRISDIIS